MDPLSTASAFSTIIALIGQFRGERSGGKQADFNEFLESLVTSQHEDLKRLLETNTRATIGIKALLNEDRKFSCKNFKVSTMHCLHLPVV